MNPSRAKTRLDIALVERGLVPTRNKAQALIMAGQAAIDGKQIIKSDALVTDGNIVTLLSQPKYVSRGGDKLEGALDDFSVSVEGKICIDVGSSTGGFTDCLLQRGASKVYAVDVGTHQFDSRLKNNSKIVLMEETHIKDVKPESLDTLPEIAVIDVSFISLTKVIPVVKILIARPGIVLAMVKPQFEVGPKYLKKGVVRSEEKQREAVLSVKTFAKELGFELRGETPARIKGPKGNQEYFLHLTI